jgi:Uma2 family endonuclease
METTTKARTATARFESRTLLRGISWSTYEALLKDLEHSAVRLTYDRGLLEIMSPLPPHEVNKHRLRRLIETLTEELDIPIQGGGSTTFKSELINKGLEADECYWVRHEPQVRNKKSLDLDTDPPPDIGLEIENTRSILKKMSIYSALGVPEVWRFNGRTLRVATLNPDGTYVWSNRSPTFTFLDLKDLVRFVQMIDDEGETHWIRGFRIWVRENLAPRYREAADAGPQA